MTSSLVAEGIVRRIGTREVLAGVSLDVAPRELVALVGPNGAGKSTLFRSLVGEDVPDAGRVDLFGRDVTRLPLHVRASRGIGYLPQGPSVLPELDARDNLRAFVGLARRALSRAEREREVERLLVEVELAPRARVRASSLSGGERRRLEVARVLSAAPRVVVADEPFAALDPRSSSLVARLLRKMADDGAALLVADHRAAQLLACADRALVLVDGRVVVTGTPARVRDDIEARRLYLGEPDG
ncbi:MAG: ATP-binding cassette domain-containing protein [Deltaproteobacteria bacterium]|nr:ATP-binding cassette domain-containing protein [Deltaproteobacteria bacterium]